MNREEKVAEVEKLKGSFEKAKAVLFADFRGVTSNDMNDMRASFRGKNAEVKVVKNNLVRWALKGTKKEKAVENLAGSTVASIRENQLEAKLRSPSDSADLPTKASQQP